MCCKASAVAGCRSNVEVGQGVLTLNLQPATFNLQLRERKAQP